MSIEEAIVALLATEDDVTDLIGSRLYPDQAPQDADFPYVVYSQADRKSVMTHAGPVALDAWGMSFEVEAATKASARAAASAIRTKLLGFKGTAGDLQVRGIFDDSESGSLEIPTHADERGIFSVSQDFTIWYAQ